MSGDGWIYLDAGPFERLAQVAVCVAGKWARAGENLPAPAGRARVEVRAGLNGPLSMRGILVVETFVAPDRVTTVRVPQFW
jgi:hypothetical protein